MGLRKLVMRAGGAAVGASAAAGAAGATAAAANAATPPASIQNDQARPTDFMPLARRRAGVDRAAAVRADVDAAELLRIAGDVEDQPPLVLIVVDARPGGAAVRGAEEAALPLHRAHQVHRGHLGARRGLAEAEAVDLLDAGDAREL